MAFRLPSLQALVVFETCARQLSFTKAAGELHVTVVAVSRMVARLEEALGFNLFVRSRGGLSLTNQGQRLLASVSSGFKQIGATIDELRQEQAQRDVVTLAVYSGFAATWLLPRFPDFLAAFPTVTLRLQVMAGRHHGPLEGADLGILLDASGRNGKLKAVCPEIILPVCSPDYLVNVGSVDAPASGKQHTLIHVEPTSFGWSDYFKAADLHRCAQAKEVHYTDPSLALQGAMLGQGTVLGWLLATSTLINAGKVVPAGSKYIHTGHNYVLAKGANSSTSETERVSQWLIHEMTDDLRRVQPVLDSLVRIAS
jgi:LysR family transcriptional regulator, glycine cleavage system transcriptional activator